MEYISLRSGKMMEKTGSIQTLQQQLASARGEGKSIGLIPTMGALHEGHLSLIRSAQIENDYLVVTIFVNPTQFNNLDDLEKYPRNLDTDLSILEECPVDMVFAPTVEEMYPSKEEFLFDLSPLDSVMEGKFRPGHFNGVVQIVSKLFEITSPDRAYFGLKDFQQLAIIQKLNRSLALNIKIVGCPIIREKDGLAMSSRNRLLEREERLAAPHIYKTLLKSKELHYSHSVGEIKKFVEGEINRHPLMKLEYFEIVNDETLMPVSEWDPAVNKVGCIAVHLGDIRLIDNIYFD